MVVTADDIPGPNHVALIENDQPLLAKDRVRHPQEPILLVAHPVRAKAYAALAHVRVEYEEEAPLLDAEQSTTVFKSFHIERGDVDARARRRRRRRRGRVPRAAPGAGLHRDERGRGLVRGRRHARDARLAAVPVLRRQGAQGILRPARGEGARDPGRHGRRLRRQGGVPERHLRARRPAGAQGAAGRSRSSTTATRTWRRPPSATRP